MQIGVRTKVIDFCAKCQLNRGSYEGALEIKGENQDQNKLLEYRTSSSIPGSDGYSSLNSSSAVDPRDGTSSSSPGSAAAHTTEMGICL